MSSPLKDNTIVVGLGPVKPVDPKPVVLEQKVEKPAPVAAPSQNPKNLQSSLQNLIVSQNKYLRILMSEQAFSINCSDTFNSNIFGEDQSNLIQLVSKSKGGLQQLIKKA